MTFCVGLNKDRLSRLCSISKTIKVRKTLQAFRKMSSFLLIAGVDISGGNGNGQKRRKIPYKGKGESRKRHSPSVLGSYSQPLI